MYNNRYNIGGILSSAGGMAATGMSIGGPVGAAIGGGLGLITGIIGSKKEEEAKERAKQQQQAAIQREFDANLDTNRAEAFENTINQPINPAELMAYGGLLGADSGGVNINFNDSNTFKSGGTHEQNPHGGIPLGTGDNGKMNTVEEGEVSIDLGKGNKYIFSDRLIYE